RYKVNPLLTIDEAAALLRCTKAAIRKWIYQRRFSPVKVGRLTRLRLEDIEAVAPHGLPGPGQAAQPVRRAPRSRQEPRSADDRSHAAGARPSPTPMAPA